MSAMRPVQGDPSTYPQVLREALERCDAAQPDTDARAVYEVVKDTESSYMDDSNAIVGTYNSVKEANEHAIEHLLSEGFWDAALDEAEIEVKEGIISVAVATDGSTGGYTTIFVRKAERK